MKRDAVMAMLMANHVIDMIKQKRAEEDNQIKAAKPDDKKDHPVKEAIQGFFNSNLKAFGCERENVVKLMSALTGFEYAANFSSTRTYYDQYSVIASLVDYKSANMVAVPGTILLVGSNNGRVFTPKDIQTTGNQTTYSTNGVDARRATDEEYAAFMKELDTEAGKKKLVMWMASNGIADCFFGLKLSE